MNRGMLYGVSVGPGDGGLLTLKALRIIGECGVVAAPRTADGAMVALEIVRSVASLEGKELLPLDFSMAQEAGARAAAHGAAAAKLRAVLDGGRSVAMLNLGDVSLYASFQYMADLLGEGYPVRMVPGVPSFCAAAARLGMSLTEMDRPLHLLPGRVTGGGEELRGTKIYMKSGRQLGRLLDELGEAGRLERAALVQNCGMEGERVFYGEEAKTAPEDYFSIVIVKE